jgi:hypothetical protein
MKLCKHLPAWSMSCRHSIPHLPPMEAATVVLGGSPGVLLNSLCVCLQVTQVAKGYAEARKLRTLSPHRDAVQPRCHHFGPCGGCTLQSLAYGKQLAEKQNQVRG